MGLFQKAVETFDCHHKYVGVVREGHEVLAPVSHSVTRADIEITLDPDGQLIDARTVDKKEPKILIPVTEESAGRAGTNPVPHPLCDQIGYLIPDHEKKYAQFVDQLSDWAASEFAHPKLSPVLTYIQAGTILRDLIKRNLIDPAKDNSKLMVCWQIIGLDDGAPSACWMDRSLFDSFTKYYRAKKEKDGRAVCMVSGMNEPQAKQHPKGVVALFGNAKLISSNDKSGFTYRGRFEEDWQASSVGYETSQKAHNALRWLTSEQGVSSIFGGRTFICWNPQGHEVCNPTLSFRKKNAAPRTEPTDYRKDLWETLTGYQSQLPETAGVVIAVFDAATTGRLSLTYYNELLGSDFLQRLYDWDLSCCWYNGPFGIQSPLLKDIVDYAFGTQRTEKGKTRLVTDDRILKQQMQKLLSCRVDRAKFPFDIERMLVQRANHMELFEDNPGKDVYLRRKLLFVTCAVIRKYRKDNFKEEWSMALEPDKDNRSYQYGRLLAVLEKMERDTYDDSEKREPNAIRMQPVFVQRPQYAAAQIWSQVRKGYLPKLKPYDRVKYEKLIGKIMDRLSNYPDSALKKPLEDTYMLGYYLQRNELYQKTKTTTQKEDSEDEQLAEQD